MQYLRALNQGFMMEKGEHHLLGAIRESVKNRWFLGVIMNFRLGVGAQEAAENALDLNARGMHANRFQRCV